MCAQTVAVGDSARAAAGHGARHRHEPARAAPPRALARRRAPARRQPAAARLAPPQGTKQPRSIILIHLQRLMSDGDLPEDI